MTSRAKGQVPGPGGIQAPGGSGAQGCELRFWLTRLRRNLRKNVPGSATHEKVGRHGTCCFATAPSGLIRPGPGCGQPRRRVSDQLDELPAPEPLIEGVLSRHAYGIICGRDATFKTFIALDWALSGHCLISAGTLTAYRIGPR